jgi:hypothetical protein
MLSAANSRNQESIAALTLKKETIIESRKMKGIAKLRTR